MKKKLKLLIASLLIMAISSMVAFAQSFTATASTLKGDVDYISFLDPRYYKEAEINNFLSYTKLGSQLNIGFGKQFSTLFLGANYSGNLWGSINKWENNDTLNFSNNSSNDFNFLLGFGNMGIQAHVDFQISGSESKNKITTEKEDYHSVTANLQWGGSFDFDNFSLKPIVKAGYENQSRININSSNSNYRTDKFMAQIGLDLAFGNKKDLYSIVGINYEISPYCKKALNKKGEIQNFNRTADNNFDLSYKITWAAMDKLELGGSIFVNNSFSFGKVTLSNGEELLNSFAYSMYSNINMGLKYHVIPSRFTIATGYKIFLPSLNVNKTTGNTNETSISSQTNFSSRIYSGFQWTIFNGFKADFSLGINPGSSSIDNIISSIAVGVSYRR